MNLLLDTHVAIWALNDDPALSGKARKLILDPDNTIYYSTVSVWEIQLNHERRPQAIPFSEADFAEGCREADFIPLNLSDKHILAVSTQKRDGDSKPPASQDAGGLFPLIRKTERFPGRRARERAARVAQHADNHASENMSLPTPQRGHSKSSGRSSNFVPGAMPFSGLPSSSSYSQPQASQTYFAMMNTSIFRM